MRPVPLFACMMLLQAYTCHTATGVSSKTCLPARRDVKSENDS